MDSMLKWMLVTCFGYTGYRNAKFGRIDVHEEINRIGREIFLRTKQIAEEFGFEVIHGVVDCLWLKGHAIWELKERVELETGLLTEVENGIYENFAKNLLNADPGELVIRRVVGRREYSKKTLEASAVKEYKRLGFEISPGMAVEFLVVDSRRKAVRVRVFDSFDIDYYLSLLRRAWEEIEFSIRALRPEN